MSKATAKNEIQVVLQEYLGNRKAAKVAETVYAVIQKETQHAHNGKKFFINEDSNGALVLTMESMVKEQVETILTQYLEKDEVQECLQQLIVGGISTETELTQYLEKDEVQECLQQLIVGGISTETELTAEFETITVEGSDSQVYFDMLKYAPASETEKEFLEFLKEAVDAGVKTFKVPVCDPSIDENGSLQFVAGCKPAVGYSYNELKEIAIKNGVQLGSKNQYVLFLATIIHRLVEEGWSKADAFFAVCTDSTQLGHYWNSEKARHDFEVTGSRKIAGKCDLANTYKILRNDERAGGFWVASGSCNGFGDFGPLAGLNCNCDSHFDDSVGWFVL